MRKKPVYETMTLERHVGAPREAVWATLLAMIEQHGYRTEGDPPPHGAGSVVETRADGYDLVETTLALEPPWRRVYRVDGFPLAYYQGTITIRDDGPTCHVAWSVIAEAGPDAPARPILDAVRPTLEGALERLGPGDQPPAR